MNIHEEPKKTAAPSTTQVPASTAPVKHAADHTKHVPGREKPATQESDTIKYMAPSVQSEKQKADDEKQKADEAQGKTHADKNLAPGVVRFVTNAAHNPDECDTAGFTVIPPHVRHAGDVILLPRDIAEKDQKDGKGMIVGR